MQTFDWAIIGTVVLMCIGLLLLAFSLLKKSEKRLEDGADSLNKGIYHLEKAGSLLAEARQLARKLLAVELVLSVGPVGRLVVSGGDNPTFECGAGNEKISLKELSEKGEHYFVYRHEEHLYTVMLEADGACVFVRLATDDDLDDSVAIATLVF